MSQTQTLLARLKEAVLAGEFEPALADSLLELSSPPSSSSGLPSPSGLTSPSTAPASDVPTQALDKLHQIISGLPWPLPGPQLHAAASYLLRLASYLNDGSKLAHWTAFLHLLLDRSHEPFLEQIVHALFLELSQHHPSLCDLVLQRYISHAKSEGSSMPVERNLLVYFQHNLPKRFFTSAAEGFASHSDRTTLLRLAELLTFVAQKQGPNLHEFCESPAFNALLSRLEETQDSSLMVVGVLAFLMLLPSILTSIASTLPRLLAGVLRRAMVWSFTGKPPPAVVHRSSLHRSASDSMIAGPSLRSSSSSVGTPPPKPPLLRQSSEIASTPHSPSPLLSLPSLSPSSSTAAFPTASAFPAPTVEAESFKRTAALLVQHVNALFPNNLLQFFRTESAKDPTFQQVCQSVMPTLRWNPALILHTVETELLVDRWRGVLPGQFVAEFLSSDVQTEWELTWPQVKSSPEMSSHRKKELGDAFTALDDPDAFHTIAGDKIYRLQTLLEQSLFHSTSETDELSGVSEQKAEDLQTQVLILRNQVLMEKYLRQQLSRRMVAVQRNSLRSDQLLAECQALEAKLKIQAQQEEQMAKKLKAHQDSTTELREQNRRLHQNFTLQLNQAREQMKQLQEEQYKVANDSSMRATEMGELKQLVAKKEDQVMKQQTLIGELSTKLKEKEGFQRRIVSMREELIIWEEQHKKMKETAKEIVELRQQLHHREEVISRLLRQVEDASYKNSDLDARMDESVERMTKMKTEHKELKDRITQLQDLLEYQKLIGVTRYNAVDAKYTSMKQIAAGLERHVMDLNLELEKYKRFAKTVAESQGAIDDPTLATSPPSSTSRASAATTFPHR